MKPIGNIFGFDCATCEHNRHCYGGNMGNQFRYCQKSAEKIQNLDNLEKQNKQLKDNWNKLKEWVNKYYDYYRNNEDYIGGKLCFTDMKDKMQELEDKEDYIVKLQATKDRLDRYDYERTIQQQEFIKYLESCIKELENESPNKLQNVLNLGISDITKEILQKYKKILGGE